MTSFITELKQSFQRGSIYLQLIYINVAMFVVVTLSKIILQLFNLSPGRLFDFLELPASIDRIATQPWSLLTYMFMHQDLLHILFNMLWLYWFGTLFLLFFSSKHFRGLYILGGICGGVLYIAAYNIFPYFRPLVAESLMRGASASVLAIVAATAYREPNYSIRLFLFGSVRLKYIALAVIGIDLLSVTSANGGGHISHLGGALAGLWFASALQKGRDLTAWINRIIDSLAHLFRGKTGTPRMKVKATQGKRGQDYDYNARRKAKSEEIDRILDKLKKSGYDSLTTEEKKSLFDASKR